MIKDNRETQESQSHQNWGRFQSEHNWTSEENSFPNFSLSKTHRPKLSIFRVSFIKSFVNYICFWVLYLDRFVLDLEIGSEALWIFPMGFDFHFRSRELWLKKIEKIIFFILKKKMYVRTDYGMTLSWTLSIRLTSN